MSDQPTTAPIATIKDLQNIIDRLNSMTYSLTELRDVSNASDSLKSAVDKMTKHRDYLATKKDIFCGPRIVQNESQISWERKMATELKTCEKCSRSIYQDYYYKKIS
jgi:hypothetical protein